MLRVLYLPPVLRTKLLSQLHSTCRTVFHALSAGNTFIPFHPGGKRAAAHVGCIEQLGRPKRVADVHIAVTDSEDFILPVDIRDLMDKSVVLRFPENLHGLLVGDVMALACLPAVVRKIPHADAPVHLIVPAAFPQHFPADAAGTLAHADMPLVLFQPVGNVFQVDSPVFHGDRFFHWDHMHPDPGPSRRDHVGNAVQRNESHSLEKAGQRRMLFQTLVPLRRLFHVKKLRRAWHKHGQAVPAVRRSRYSPVVVIIVAVIIFQEPDVAHLIQYLLEMGLLMLLDLVHFPEFFDLVVTAHLHLQRNIRHLLGHDLSQPPILRVVHCDSLQLMRCNICNFFPKL